MTNLHTESSHTKTPSRLNTGVVFFFVTMGVIALTYGFFYAIDFLPEKKVEKETEIKAIDAEKKETDTDSSAVGIDPFPETIIFDALDREVTILNPETADAATLDEALLKGVIRHPDSADFARKGTMFLLGHSSYLPVVRNKNFQAFNGIQKMKWGDTIRLRSSDKEYVYSVDKVYEAKASNASVPIEWGIDKLILATCNSFGTKEDRYMVEASLVEVRDIGTPEVQKG